MIKQQTTLEAKRDAGRHQNKQHFLFLCVSGGSNAAKIASSNTFFSPRCRVKRRRREREAQTGVRDDAVSGRRGGACVRAHALAAVRDLTCVRAEHSTYFTALRSRASFSAVSGVIGFCLFLASFSTVEGSSRRSIWVPTNRKGVLGQW